MEKIRIKRDLGPVIRAYLIGSMETCGTKGSIGKEWREKCIEMLSTLVDEKGQSIYVFNPVKLEELKTGRSVKGNLEYLTNLKRGGSWEKYKEEQGKIWYGVLYTEVNKSDLKDSLLSMLSPAEYIFQNFSQLKTFLMKKYNLKEKKC